MHGEIDRITTGGKISRLIDISASQGHAVPTSITFHNGQFFTGNLTNYPLVQGAANVYRITRQGAISVAYFGFTEVVAADYGPDGNLYVLESNVGVPFPTPGTGELLRVKPDKSVQTVLAGLNIPTAMTFGPGGALYISNWGYGYHTGAKGQVLKVCLGQ